MVTKTIAYFDIAQICRSGQCFRMDKKEHTDNTYRIIALDRYLEVEQEGEKCIFHCKEDEFESFWKQYFDLETGYDRYCEAVDVKDSYLNRAINFGNGIRILRQDLWEMIVSFLISQQNNITRIKKCIKNICEVYGEERTSKDGEIYYAFPKPEALALLDEDALKACNLGYRSKYVVRTAKAVADGLLDLEALAKLSYPEARKELLKLYGVGVKVADCICLFGLHHLQAFPVDTHINQAMQNHYPDGFPSERYQGFEGVIQQYIFYYELFGQKMEVL